MTAPKKRPRRKPVKRRPDYVMAAIPDDTFGAATDPLPPKSPEAPALRIDERLEYLLNNPDLYAAAGALPGPGRVGRPAQYPPIVYLIFLCAISLFGSARATACHLQGSDWWGRVRTGIRTHLGDEIADALQPVGPSRGQWNYYFHTKLKPAFADVRDISRDLWIQQALDHGMMSETAQRVSRSYPERHQVIHADATVASPPSSQRHRKTVNKETGEIRYHRVDPDASLTVEGGDKIVYGNKFLSAAIRLANIPHSRVILGIESVRTKSAELDPERDDEGTAFVELAKSILSRAPRLRAITYDTGLRGVHRAPLIAEGLVVFTTQHGGLTPESLERYEEGPCHHDIYVAEGRACERLITVEGTTHYIPLPVEELECREGKRTRFYHRLTIPCRVKKHTMRIRVDETAEDSKIDPSTKRQRFNRTEHLRQVPPDTHAGRRLKGFRQDSESQHSRFDQAYTHERVPAYGANAALLIYLGYAWLSNSVARAKITHALAA